MSTYSIAVVVGSIRKDSFNKKLAVALAKLAEWSAPGKYGERADAALRTCTKP